MATLVDEEKVSGRYEVEWQPAAISSSIYFYRLSVVPEAPRDLVPPTAGRTGRGVCGDEEIDLPEVNERF